MAKKCEHGRQKHTCKECGGASICEHGRRKSQCKECGGASICEHGRRKSQCKECGGSSLCKSSWCETRAIKKYNDGCSKRRPDLLLDMGSHIIIVEIDENKHTNYDCSCENKRLMELSQDLQHRPIIFIRFNPDDYTNQEGILVKSCWKLNKLGVMQITKTKQNEWEERIEALKQQIQYWIDNPTEKTIEIVELFY